eukprot:jgi/Chlat1/3238/Chrsp22S08810
MVAAAVAVALLGRRRVQVTDVSVCLLRHSGVGVRDSRRQGLAGWVSVARQVHSQLPPLPDDFDPANPVESARTLPSEWYTEEQSLQLENARVFGRNWLAVGHVGQVQHPGSYFTGHRAMSSLVVMTHHQPSGFSPQDILYVETTPVSFAPTTMFVGTMLRRWPLGWSYDLDGRLRKATRLKGIQDFNTKNYGLVPMSVEQWGPFILISSARDQPSIADWLGESAAALSEAGMNNVDMKHVATREYELNCNWKVYCDNYLDGGYHVPFAHKGLAGALDLATYKTELYSNMSMQSCRSGGDDERLGALAHYAFIYPNFMINRYGPWMDTNTVIPLDRRRCRVVFRYYLEPNLVEDKEFINASLADSNDVQQEDVGLCEDVQVGLESPAYRTGRYAPSVEAAMHQFHCLLHKDVSSPP